MSPKIEAAALAILQHHVRRTAAKDIAHAAVVKGNFTSLEVARYMLQLAPSDAQARSQSATFTDMAARLKQRTGPWNAPMALEALRSIGIDRWMAANSLDRATYYYIERLADPNSLQRRVWSIRLEMAAAEQAGRLYGPDDPEYRDFLRDSLDLISNQVERRNYALRRTEEFFQSTRSGLSDDSNCGPLKDESTKIADRPRAR